MIKSIFFVGIVVLALASMNVAFIVLYGVSAGPILAVVVGYITGLYLLYYGIFVKEEPTLKERMKEETYREKKAKEDKV